MKKILIILSLLAVFASNDLFPQQADFISPLKPKKLYRVAAVIINGDTVPYIGLPEVEIFGKGDPTKLQRFKRLVYNVKKVYPYARLAGIKFNEYNTLMTKTTSDKEKKRLMRKAEMELKAQFGPELERLTFTQGHILLKLVDRQTRNCTYDIVKEFRGRFMAFFWQGIGRLFGYNLKDRYDPQGADSDIEYIVRAIEAGSI